MKNESEGYAGSPNKKTGIGSVPSTTSFSHDGIAPFPSILSTEEFKNTVNYECILAILSLHLENNICDVLREFVLFVQFKKREKHPWMSVNFSKVAGFSLQLY